MLKSLSWLAPLLTRIPSLDKAEPPCGRTLKLDDKNNDSTDIIVSFVDNGKTRYAVLTVSLGLNSKAKDYSTVSTSIDNGMKVIVNKVTNEANKYTYSTISANKTAMETDLLKEMQELFKTETIESVLVNMVIQ